MTISERIEAGRREQRVLARVCRAAWRLEQAERERVWALVSARAEGISIRKLAAAAELSPSRVHRLVAAADLDALDAALGELRAAGWPTPAAERASEYAAWLRGQLLQLRSDLAEAAQDITSVLGDLPAPGPDSVPAWWTGEHARCRASVTGIRPSASGSFALASAAPQPSGGRDALP